MASEKIAVRSRVCCCTRSTPPHTTPSNYTSGLRGNGSEQVTFDSFVDWCRPLFLGDAHVSMVGVSPI